MRHPNANAAPTLNASYISTPIIQPIYHNNNMPDSYAVKEARVQEALATIRPRIQPKIRQLAAEFHVPYDMLLNRYNWIPHKDSHSYALSDHEEQAVHQYLQQLDGIGMSCRRPMLLRAANSILRERPGQIRRVGSHWPTRFLKRNPQYKIRRQKPLASQRKNAHEPEAILDWFKRYKAICKEYGIYVGDIYNFNETGFRIGVGKSQWELRRNIHSLSIKPTPIIGSI